MVSVCTDCLSIGLVVWGDLCIRLLREHENVKMKLCEVAAIEQREDRVGLPVRQLQSLLLMYVMYLLVN